MPVSVTMPQLGESVTEGTVTRWLKQVGDTITADEPLLEVSTDKVDTEIPAPASGVLLAITAGEDAVVLVNQDQLGLVGHRGSGRIHSGVDRYSRWSSARAIERACTSSGPSNSRIARCQP